MSAAQVIESLLQLGVSIKGAFTTARRNHGALDWTKFLETTEFKAIETTVKGIIGSLTETDLDDAIARIRAKEAALLAGRTIAELSPDKLLQFSDLLDLETALVNRRVKSVTTSAQALAWVSEDLLPVLVKVASVVIPLLL